MSASDRRAKELFLDALEHPTGERELFVASACGQDTALAQRVLALLGAHGEAEQVLPGLLVVPVVEGSQAAAAGPGQLRAGARIGPNG